MSIIDTQVDWPPPCNAPAWLMEPRDRDYATFLADKINFDSARGFDVDDADLDPILLPHQRILVKWAVRGGRRAIFAAFGLGKSIMQIETIRLTLEKVNPHAAAGLIVCPLGVKQEFMHDARMLGIDLRFIRRTEEFDGQGIYITNYESVRDGKLDPTIFDAVSLDEASVLRSFGSKTYQTFLTLFDGVPYRFLATATPSPNRHKELIHYAGYLGIMDTGAALTRWFQRDSTQANNLTLYPHKEREFWLWLHTWAAFVQSPADLGCDATGYDLPELVTHWHEISVNHADAGEDRDGQGRLYRGGALSLVDASREKRRTLGERVAELVAIVVEQRDDGQIVLWCHLNDEQAAIERALDAEGITHSSVHGALDLEEAEARIAAWKNRETHALIGKPVMLGQGMNLQQARRAVFVGIDYKFNDFIQATHRIQRFGQTRRCHVHVIQAESEAEIKRELLAKWGRHKELTATMTGIIREHGFDSSATFEELKRAMGTERVEVSGDGWTIAHNDCIPEVTNHMDDASVDLIVTSIPFSNHYEYTPNYADLGHTDDNAHFWAQMDYLTPQLHRVLAPGRIYACHVKDRILFGHVTGAGLPTVSPFHAEALFHGIKHGFDYLGMITVTTDVVRENNQSYRLGYTKMTKDGSNMGVGSPEYILLFHKPQTDRTAGWADERITKEKAAYSLARWQIDAHAFWRSSGDRLLTPEELIALPVEQRSRLFTEQTMREVYDHEVHVRIGEELEAKGALPQQFMSLAPGSVDPLVWHDVTRMRTLNGEQKNRNVQLHVCPLQLDIVDRLIRRYSQEGETVFDPFGGLMTVPYRALLMGRKGRGVELNPGYFADGTGYMRAAEQKLNMPTLFGLLDDEAKETS